MSEVDLTTRVARPLDVDSLERRGGEQILQTKHGSLTVGKIQNQVAIVAAGVTTTAAVVTRFRRLNDRIDAGLAEATRERAEIRERLAHLEGTLDVLRSYFAPRQRDEGVA